MAATQSARKIAVCIKMWVQCQSAAHSSRSMSSASVSTVSVSTLKLTFSGFEYYEIGIKSYRSTHVDTSDAPQSQNLQSFE